MGHATGKLVVNMAAPATEHVRNIVLVGQDGAGKTSLAEAMLFDCGVISRMGRVEDKNTVSDFDAEEQKRSISINSSLYFSSVCLSTMEK